MAQMSWSDYAEEASKIGAGGFTLMPVGTHNVTVESAEVKDTKAGKGLLLRLVAFDGPSAGQSILNTLAQYKNDGTINPFFMTGIGALGLGPKDQPDMWRQLGAMTDVEGMEALARAALGRKCTIDVTHRTWNGAEQDNVKRMKPLGGAAPAVGPAPAAVTSAPMPAPSPVVPAAPVAPAPAPAPAPAAPAPAPAPAPAAPVAPAPSPEAAPVEAPSAFPFVQPQVDPMTPPEGKPF